MPIPILCWPEGSEVIAEGEASRTADFGTLILPDPPPPPGERAAFEVYRHDDEPEDGEVTVVLPGMAALRMPFEVAHEWLMDLCGQFAEHREDAA